ncbi:hypothetical protein DL98DRAFT_593150 [Cadophora sp. DSE1049]|nr:hypothetical protein DL98DRAFT_593150 [Cadophora sp. DSE1049]
MLVWVSSICHVDPPSRVAEREEAASSKSHHQSFSKQITTSFNHESPLSYLEQTTTTTYNHRQIHSSPLPEDTCMFHSNQAIGILSSSPSNQHQHDLSAERGQIAEVLLAKNWSLSPRESVSGTSMKMIPPQSTSGCTPSKASIRESLQPSQKIAGDGDQPLVPAMSSSMDQDVGVNKTGTSTPHKPISISESVQSLQTPQASGSSSFQTPTAVLNPPLISLTLQSSDRFSPTDSSSSSFRSATTLIVPPKTFTLFPKLPLELRRMIWREILAIPQVISIDYGGCVGLSSSKEHKRPVGNWGTLTTVSSEARTEALKVQKPLELLTPMDRRISYWNADMDVIWVSGLGDIDCDLFIISDMRYIMTPLPRMAFSLEFWYYAMTYFSSEILRRLYDYGTEEILLVVADRAAFGSGQVVFVEPRSSCTALVPADLLRRWAPYSDTSCTWDMLSKAIIEEVRGRQLEEEKRRKLAIAGTDPLESYPLHFYLSQEATDWSFEQIRLVEATTYADLGSS